MKEQYQQRLDKLMGHLHQQQVDLAIINSPKNVFYYTGFNSDPHERFMALVLDLRNGNQYLFVPALDKEAAEKNSTIQNLVPITDEVNPYQVLRNTVGEGIRKIGLETKNISLFQQEQLHSIFSDFSYQNIGEFLSGQRMRKTAKECHKVQVAVQVIEKVMAEGIKKVNEGMSEQDLAAELEFLMRKFGADGPSFTTIVLSGEKASLPHGRPDRKKMMKGEFILIDMGVIVDGYCSDITRTFILGEETAKQRKIYDIVRESTNAGVHAAKAGVTAGSVDIAARNVIKVNGYGQYFNNRVGHGLGMEVHEEPSMHEKNETILEPGFLFTVEPGIYIPGYGGVRIEEDVYIGEDGKAKVLTTFPTELIRIG
ncbi:M24 family metallopeptidase [Neobacillus sp. M.A.Huq-85]|nr:Xaa-Pro peptidase family protein [Neobacillus cucumis]